VLAYSRRYVGVPGHERAIVPLLVDFRLDARPGATKVISGGVCISNRETPIGQGRSDRFIDKCETLSPCDYNKHGDKNRPTRVRSVRSESQSYPLVPLPMPIILPQATETLRSPSCGAAKRALDQANIVDANAWFR
jgi:hypothetical protein